MNSSKQLSTRDAYGKALLKLGKINSRIVALTADLSESVRTHWFAEKYSKRFFNCGVAEQNMCSVAAGMALGGYIPFMSSFAIFSPGRNWEQIRQSICYNQANVKIVSTHSGLGVGEDGATHQALEDIALARVLPHLKVIVPADYNEAYQAVLAAAKIKGPVYIRLTRQASPVITKKNQLFKLGQAQILVEGRDLTIISTGTIIVEVLKSLKLLKKKGIKARIINLSSIKPIDEKIIIKAAQETGRIFTVEEHQISGGLGSAVAEVVSQHCPAPVYRIGVNDEFGQSGTAPELWKHYGLDAEGLYKRISNCSDF